MHEKDFLNNEYFEWIYKQVIDDKYSKNLSYRKLLFLLHKKSFIPIMKRDMNRAIDGKAFRYRFGVECGYSKEEIRRNLTKRYCSMLEMMIALSYRIEEELMTDFNYGDRTGQWFWNMIVSLGLGTMCDERFDKDYCEFVLDKFINREYKSNGEGGLFTVDHCKYDLTKEEIWYQAMWYLSENFDFTL